jgi:hypothetical protein
MCRALAPWNCWRSPLTAAPALIDSILSTALRIHSLWRQHNGSLPPSHGMVPPLLLQPLSAAAPPPSRVAEQQQQAPLRSMTSHHSAPQSNIDLCIWQLLLQRHLSPAAQHQQVIEAARSLQPGLTLQQRLQPQWRACWPVLCSGKCKGLSTSVLGGGLVVAVMLTISGVLHG